MGIVPTEVELILEQTQQVTLKRRRNDADKYEEPSAGSDQGSKRRREGKEPESTSALKEKVTKTTGKSTQGSKSHQKTTSKSALAEEPMQTTQDLEEPSHQEFKIGAADDQPIAEASQFAVNRESARDFNLKCRIIAVTKLQIVEWHNYKHLDWITVRKDDDKLYKFKEGDFKRFHIQDIEDMLLLLVQGKVNNLTVKERFAFNVTLRMFTRSIVIQRRVEDLQLGVKSYQKKLNLTKPDMYCSNLKRKQGYTTYSNPRGLIYQNKDKQNMLMRIDELHKFSNGTLNDVQTALDDRLKGIWRKYLPQAIWRKSDKERATSMIHAINKQLKTSSKPGLQCMTSGQISLGLDLTYAPSTITTQQPTEGELDLLFEAMYDDYFGGQPSANVENVSTVQEPQVRQTSTAFTSSADNVPIPTNSFSHATNIPIPSQDVDELNPNAMVNGNTQNQRDLPRDIPLDIIEVLRYDTKGVKMQKGKMQIKTELTLEQTQQGVSDKVLVSIEGIEELKINVKIKGEKKEALLILRQKPVTVEILPEQKSNKLCGR
nr:hypothetical protein [Tanacetum cinerariifolium]